MKKLFFSITLVFFLSFSPVGAINESSAENRRIELGVEIEPQNLPFAFHWGSILAKEETTCAEFTESDLRADHMGIYISISIENVPCRGGPKRILQQHYYTFFNKTLQNNTLQLLNGNC